MLYHYGHISISHNVAIAFLSDFVFMPAQDEQHDKQLEDVISVEIAVGLLASA